MIRLQGQEFGERGEENSEPRGKYRALAALRGTYVGCAARLRPASTFAATSANTPRMIPDTTPITGPVIAIISRGELAIGDDRIISASRA